MIKIAVDAMGGDQGLKATVPAALIALSKSQDLEIYLVGDQVQIESLLQSQKEYYDAARLHIVHATQKVEMDELPSVALRTKKDSSMRVAINLVKEGKADAIVSSGNTGALMATARFVLKTLANIDRPAIVYPMPSMNYETGELSSVYLLDLGANVACTAEQLFQFGVMGSVLATTETCPKPRLALLNVGEEEMKGLETIKAAAKMFQACSAIHYIGYAEGNDIFRAKADVIVCDGFAGNVALKTTEGVASLIGKILKDAFADGVISKICMILSAPVLNRIKKRLDMSQYNGGTFLGLRGTVVKSHGGVDAKTFVTAIDEAIIEVKRNVPARIEQQVTQIIQNEIGE